MEECKHTDDQSLDLKIADTCDTDTDLWSSDDNLLWMGGSRRCGDGGLQCETPPVDVEAALPNVTFQEQTEPQMPRPPCSSSSSVSSTASSSAYPALSATEESSLLLAAAQFSNSSTSYMSHTPPAISPQDSNDHSSDPHEPLLEDNRNNNNGEVAGEAAMAATIGAPPRPRPPLRQLLRSASVKVRALSAWQRLADRVDDVLVVDQMPAVVTPTSDGSSGGTATNEVLRESSMSDIRASRQQSRRLVVEDIQAGMQFTLSQCLLAVLCYLLTAVVVFTFIFDDHFTIIDSMYFAVVTFTTIGYGDLVPESSVARIFTCFFALTGVACLGIVLGVIGNNVLEAEQKAMEGAREISKTRTLSLFRPASEPEPPATFTPEGESVEPSPVEGVSSLGKLVVEFLALITLLGIFALFLADDPGINASGWDEVGNALYYAVITASTIGYGDMSPKSQGGRLFAIFFVPIAVGAMGHWLSMVAGYIIDGRQCIYRRKFESQELTMQSIEAMDDDGDGEVTEVEFLTFLLVAMGKVDQGTIDSLRQHFVRLDTDGTGTLSKDDLIQNAKKKLKGAQHKLHLQRYKQSLLERAAAGREGRRSSFWRRNSWLPSGE